MKRIQTILTILASAAVVTLAVAQAPVASVDPSHHGSLAAAQHSIQAAFNSISAAQSDNNDHLGGHAQRAKELLREANDEISAAASVADGSQQNGQASSAPPSDAAPVMNTPPPAMPNTTAVPATPAAPGCAPRPPLAPAASQATPRTTAPASAARREGSGAGSAGAKAG